MRHFYRPSDMWLVGLRGAVSTVSGKHMHWIIVTMTVYQPFGYFVCSEAEGLRDGAI